MRTVLDPTKMYEPTAGGPTVRKRKLYTHSTHKWITLVPQIPENNPAVLLPPHDSFLDGRVNVYRANTLDYLPSEPSEFGLDFYEAFFAIRAEAMRRHVLNVHQNYAPGDVIQGNHFLELALAASAAAYDLNLPFVYQIHAPISGFIDRSETNTRSIRKNHLKQSIEEAIFSGGEHIIGNRLFNLKKPDRVITISQFTKAHLAGKYNLSDDNIDVVPNGLDSRDITDRKSVQDDTAKFYSKHHIPNNTFVIAYAGAIDELNGIGVLLDVMDRISAQGIAAHLVLVGDDRKNMLANSLKSSWLTHIQHLDDSDVRRLYRGADLMTMPRLKMTAADYIVPLKPYEAIQEGAALLLSENEILKEVFAGGAIFVKPGDKNDLERKLVSVIINGIDPEIKANAGKILKRQPLWGDVVKVYDSAFEKV